MRIYQTNVERELAVLRSVSRPAEFSDSTLRLVDQMTKILIRTGNGIGLAAPQVGSGVRLFLVWIDRNREPLVFVNPEKMETSSRVSSLEEGCLSVPKIEAVVERPASVTVQAWSLTEKPFTLKAEGLLSTVIQHEMDHLNGILFIDHLKEPRRSKLLKKMTRR